MTGDHRTITDKLDSVKQLTDKEIEFWRARDLMPIMGYVEWRNFESAISRAIAAFDAAGEDAPNHFVKTTKMVEIGSGAERGALDYFLSRPACYLIAMNGEPSKPEIAEAQRYFAVRTRQMEKLITFLHSQRRLDLRKRVKDHNSALSRTAKEAGVTRFGVFHGAGIRAMYEMSLAELKLKRGLDRDEDWLDRQGVEELAANEFRITQTDSKISREGIRGEDKAIRAHEAVGREVRATINKLGNTMPENLPIEPPIKDVERRLRPQTKKALPRA